MEKPHRPLLVENRRHNQDWYFKKIVKMGKEGKVLEAIAVLDDWMLVRDRVMPNEDIYTAIIGIIGRTGNASLAFAHFKKMREYGLKPNEATFTALFNACSNCPDQEIAKKKGNYLRNYMRRTEVIPNIITYNAIIKMFGRFGDLPNAFLVADEALSNRRRADSFFYGSLLSAAISDKEEGLLYAIEDKQTVELQLSVSYKQLQAKQTVELQLCVSCKQLQATQTVELQLGVSCKQLQAKETAKQTVELKLCVSCKQLQATQPVELQLCVSCNQLQATQTVKLQLCVSCKQLQAKQTVDLQLCVSCNQLQATQTVELQLCVSCKQLQAKQTADLQLCVSCKQLDLPLCVSCKQLQATQIVELQLCVSCKQLQAKIIGAVTEITPHQSSQQHPEHPPQKCYGDLEGEGVQPLRIGATTEITAHQSSQQHPEHPPQKCYGDLKGEGVKYKKSPKTLEQRKQKQAEESKLELHTEHVADDTAVSLLSEEQVDTSLSSMTVAKFPDLLDPVESFSEVVSLGNMSEGKDRLLLMGGIKGFLRRMKADEVSPDISVLTWLVQMTRGKEDEEIILSALEEGKIKADSTFLNALMRTKAHQESYDDAKAVLQLFTKYNVVPNKQTYGSLMFCTRHTDEAKEILDSMENVGLVPDIKTFGILIGKGAGHFTYKKHLLRKMESMNIKPDIYFLQIIERHLQKLREQILLEQRKNTKNSKTRRLEKDLQDLNVFYKQWLIKTKVHKEAHQLENYQKKIKLTSGRG
ncbi:Pentatricopeptide repeat-containing protein 1, mitochondrial [Mizuhopecten yessoensis]|uniref:Pentatricopeptide repeat-containing protein 1, mitochondrial n=1 Tax=Mizuhopecten yessoensis TaxID=6573 RepID=A0A210QV91_MIZYE|nr:Pentatricopeptide repeat-containing protein 1, mitochondrial [Mizuhopecten yessoensis]